MASNIIKLIIKTLLRVALGIFAVAMMFVNTVIIMYCLIAVFVRFVLWLGPDPWGR